LPLISQEQRSRAKVKAGRAGVSATGKESSNTLFIFTILGGLTLFMLVVYRPLLMYLAISDTKLKPSPLLLPLPLLNAGL
jgi:hypothetical protein